MKVEHPHIKRYRWDVGNSWETAMQAINDSLLFAEKKRPDSWIDSCRAMLKVQPMEFYKNHFPQSVKYIEAANRAELKEER